MVGCRWCVGVGVWVLCGLCVHCVVWCGMCGVRVVCMCMCMFRVLCVCAEMVVHVC